MVTKETLETLTALRRMGAKHVAFSGAGELLMVDFFEPPEAATPDLYERAAPRRLLRCLDCGFTGDLGEIEAHRAVEHGAPTDMGSLEEPEGAGAAEPLRAPGRRLLDGVTPDDPLFDGVRP